MDHASVYVVYHWQGVSGAGVGRCIIGTDVILQPYNRPFRKSEIDMIHSAVLDNAKQQNPDIASVILTWWTWVAPEVTDDA